MSTDEPTGTPAERPADRGEPQNPWVAPSARGDGSGSSGDETPTSPEPIPAAPPAGAFPPPAGSPVAGPPPGAFPPPTGTPVAGSPPAFPPPSGPPAAQQLPYGPPPTAAPPTTGLPPSGPDGAGTPGAKRSNPVGLIALLVGIVALVLAVLPIASFVAGLPALVAIVLGIVGLVLAGRRRGLATAGLIIGVVALVVAIAVSTVQFVGFVRDRVTDLPQISDFPTDFPTDLPSDLPSGGASSGAGLAAGPHTVVYRITGSGTASITYSTVANGRSATARDTKVALPRERTQQLTVTTDGYEQFVLAAITLDGRAKLTCSIEVDGKEIARNTSSASSGVELVTCDGREGGF